MIPKKPAPHSMRGGYRFSEKIMPALGDVPRGAERRQEGGACVASSHALAALSPASRSAGLRPCTKVSSHGSPAPPALATRCHLVAADGAGGRPLPVGKELAAP